MPQIYDMGSTALLPLRRKACRGFFCPKNPTASAGFELASLGTKSQHATTRPPKQLDTQYTTNKYSCVLTIYANIYIIWRYIYKITLNLLGRGVVPPCFLNIWWIWSYRSWVPDLQQERSKFAVVRKQVGRSGWNVMAHGDAREGKFRGKLANGASSQYSSHYLGTWCIQHYYRWCAHLGCQ